MTPITLANESLAPMKNDLRPDNQWTSARAEGSDGGSTWPRVAPVAGAEIKAQADSRTKEDGGSGRRVGEQERGSKGREASERKRSANIRKRNAIRSNGAQDTVAAAAAAAAATACLVSRATMHELLIRHKYWLVRQ